MLTKEAYDKLMKQLETEEVWMTKSRVISMLKYAAGERPAETPEPVTREEFMRQEPW